MECQVHIKKWVDIPSMRLWKSVRVAGLLDSKSPRAIASLQIFESVDRDTRCSRSELEKPRLLFGIPRADDLPEVLNNFILLLISTVIGVLLPIIDIDIRNTANQKLQLALVKHVDKIRWDELMESVDESIELLLYSLLDLPHGDQPGNYTLDTVY